MRRSILKTLARHLLPGSTYRRLAFSRVYNNHTWGGDGNEFFSGVGSRGEPLTIYVNALTRALEAPKTIVDLGCGDFAIGQELRRCFPNANYIGCDIVPELIHHHQRVYANDQVSFRLIDIVEDAIPPGDVYLVRQVLQHLSNAEIARVLKKLEGSSCLIVTEGQPLTLAGAKNRDKVAGADTRFDTASGVGSGVYLDAPPFNKKVEELCRVEMPGSEQIVTWRVF